MDRLEMQEFSDILEKSVSFLKENEKRFQFGEWKRTFVEIDAIEKSLRNSQMQIRFSFKCSYYLR